jgi:anti-sigma factor ChrR (cupin superfamily)
MELRSNFSKRYVVLPDEEEWRPSPIVGVERKMLDRIGDEVARATSIVKYAANARFSSHVHAGGEEILVLEGEFNDEHGHYPAGTYIRNPIGTEHTPSAGPNGTTLFVKLHQFDKRDTEQKRIHVNESEWFQGSVSGLTVLPLHSFGSENVALVRWAPNTIFKPHKHWGGEEILVLEGFFQDEHGLYPKGSWLRSPHLSEHLPLTGPQGALIFVNTGHLSA